MSNNIALFDDIKSSGREWKSPFLSNMFRLVHYHSRTLLLAIAALWLHVAHCAIPPTNLGIVVNLRIEGRNHTIFEGPIFTRGHNVTTVSGGTLHCDGTNHNENPYPGPTCTSALDDASKKANFTWDGTVFGNFDDFFITTIAEDSQTDTEFWGILLNFVFTPVGGCQQQIQHGDHVLWAFNAFNVSSFLKLEGPHSVEVHTPAVFTVLDGMTGEAIEGANIRGVVSDKSGHVTLSFEHPGAVSLKADKMGTIRSNGIKLIII
ncbi:hypothetical protein K435DRAFT_743842 [Dendrothele bispora CBS 962.96]|uniref:Uncharacterized protein n=1 Tax=Dendrothele bispora (strain CBS 962.96) TaxID=1314807 RepID=A0A4S8MTX9_DENBC|nr:hypothetical protein K435DRAFT_743842 [Dendrothele bispora CBS 962.96]